MRMTVETVGIRLFVCLSVSVCQVGSSDNTPPASALVYVKSGDDPIGSRSLFLSEIFFETTTIYKYNLKNTDLFKKNKTPIRTSRPVIKLHTLELNPKLNQQIHSSGSSLPPPLTAEA